MARTAGVFLQGRTGPYFQDFNDNLIEDLLARYPNLVRGIGLAVLLLSHVVESRAAAHPHSPALRRTTLLKAAHSPTRSHCVQLRRQHHAQAGLLLLTLSFGFAPPARVSAVAAQVSLEMETFHLLDLARCSEGNSLQAAAFCIAAAERYSNKCVAWVVCWLV